MPAPSNAVHFVFTAGGATYMALDDLDPTKVPRHGKLVQATDDYVNDAIARVAAANVSRDQRAWLHRDVIVDSACHARVTGFALVARVSGDPSYTEDPNADQWTSSSIFEHGHIVLAAMLDDCTGTYARDAASPDVTPFEEVVDPVHVAAARAAVLASDLATDAATEWSKAQQTGHWFDEGQLTGRAVRDPRSGVTWISMHGHPGYACGGPDINLWGLFRVEPDGTLTTVQLRPLGDMVSIDKLVDTDGDGIPELIGTTWLGPSMLLVGADGGEQNRLDVPFIGCPC